MEPEYSTLKEYRLSDYLVKDAEYQNIDGDALKRLKLLEKLSAEDKSHIFALMDAFFAKHKLKNLMQ